MIEKVTGMGKVRGYLVAVEGDFIYKGLVREGVFKTLKEDLAEYKDGSY